MYEGTATAASARRFYMADPLGSVIGVTDANGALLDAHSYSAFGMPDDWSADTTGNPLRYTGQRWDAETGLYHYRARYYSPALGRFLTADPIGYGDGLNVYAYVGNDPVNLVDPSGLGAEKKKGELSYLSDIDDLSLQERLNLELGLPFETEVQPIPGMAPILLTPAGAGLKSGLYLFRRGAYDTLKSLRSQAAAAEANIGSPRYFAQHQFWSFNIQNGPPTWG